MMESCNLNLERTRQEQETQIQNLEFLLKTLAPRDTPAQYSKASLQSNVEELQCRNQELAKHNKELKCRSEEMESHIKELQASNSMLKVQRTEVESHIRNLESSICGSTGSSKDHGSWPWGQDTPNPKMTDSEGSFGAATSLQVIFNHVSTLERCSKQLEVENKVLQARLRDVQMARCAALGSIVAAKASARPHSCPVSSSSPRSSRDSQ